MPIAPQQAGADPVPVAVDDEPPLPEDPSPAPGSQPPAAPAQPGSPPPPGDAFPGPPPPPPRAPNPDRALQGASYYDRCFGVPHGGYAPIGVYGEVPLGGGGRGVGPGGGLSTPNLSGGSDDKAWLVVAVVALAALPVVVYAFDSPADRIVLERFSCPSFSFQWTGGVESSKEFGNVAQGVSTGRFLFGYEHVATEFQFDGSSRSTSGFAARLLLRVTPRQHVEGGLSLGFRRLLFQEFTQDGFELGLPHEYTFWRDGLRTVGLELRPSLLFTGGGVEPSLESYLRLPIVDVLHARVGGRVYTFSGALFWGAQLGLELSL
jgi:hypothetical protein